MNELFSNEVLVKQGLRETFTVHATEILGMTTNPHPVIQD
jgi:hypothetical protein